MERRIETALEFLKDGQSFTVGDLRLGVESPGIVKVTGWSRYNNFVNLTKQRSLKELEEVKTIFCKMVDASLRLKDFVKDKSIEFNLYFDDYGKGSISICSEKDGKIKWEIDLKM